MRIKRFELVLDKDSEEFYLAGEELRGTINISVLETVRIARLSVRVFGNVKTVWRDTLTDVVYESKELILDEYKDLTNELSVYCNHFSEILKGERQLDFSIKLPLDVMSSLEKENGHIKYVCMAVLDVPQDGGSEIIAESQFGVLSYLNVDAPHFRKLVESAEEVNIIGFCCRRPKGLIRAKLIISKLGILPGETIKITVIIENTLKQSSKLKKKHKGVHQCVLLSLCQQIEFKAQNVQDRYAFDRRFLTTAVKSCGTCKANQSKGPEIRCLDFDVPHGLPPTSSTESSLIVCSYFFRLDMEHFEVIVPVVIGSQKTLMNQPETSEIN